MGCVLLDPLFAVLRGAGFADESIRRVVIDIATGQGLAGTEITRDGEG